MGVDLGPNFRNTYGNLCGAFKQVINYFLFCLILSFYPLDMAFKVSPLYCIAICCSGQPLDILLVLHFWLLKVSSNISEV